MKKQLPPNQRAHSVTFMSPCETVVVNWGWMHRARLRIKESQMGIVFPGLIVELKGKQLGQLADDIACGSVCEISEVKPGEPESHTVDQWKVSSVKFVDPDED